MSAKIRSILLALFAITGAVAAAPQAPGAAPTTPGCTQTPEPSRWLEAGTPDAGSSTPVVSAHRGANLLAPENTLGAYRAAFAHGASVVEVDVRETADGRLVSMHDDVVDRTTDGTGPVSGMTLAQLKELNASDYAPWKGSAHDPSTVPSLEEVLALARAAGGGIEFDIKSVSDPSTLVDMADAYGVLEESFFNTADPRVVVGRPEARVIYNRDAAEPPGSLFAIGARAQVFGSRLDEYSPESIAEIHDACGIVVPHTYDKGAAEELAEWQRGRAIGIDGGQTNQPDVAADALDRPVATRLLRLTDAAGAPVVCLVNATNGFGLPSQPLQLGDQERTTGPDGCAPAAPAEPVSFAGGGSALPAEGVSEPPAGLPRGAHLSFTDDPARTTTVAWFTDGLTDPGTWVEYGTGAEGCQEARLTERAEGTAAKAPGVDVLAHEATMRGLRPGTTVCYRVGGQSGWSEVRAFGTEPATDGFRFTAFGDHGTNARSRASTAAVAAARPNLHVIAGDLSYANGTQPIWDTWFGQIESLASQTPLMAALGNHEVESNFGTQTFRTRLAQPGAELYYSFDYRNVHFLFLEGGAALSEGVLADELAFADRDLADAAQRRADGELDFIVVVQHFPLWSNHDTRGPCDSSLVVAEEQILQRHQVDVLLVGHNHHFERSKPMVYGQPTHAHQSDYTDPAGYVEVIAGGGGQSLYNFVPPDQLATWSASYARRFHYVEFDVRDDVMTMRAITTDEPAAQVLDSWTLRRGTSAAPSPLAAAPNGCL